MMTGRVSARIFLACITLATVFGAYGCDSQGPNVVDTSGSNAQVALMAVGTGTGGSELAQYREATGLKSTTLYATANGSALDLPIDGMDESNNRLFLYHRAAGQITVLDVQSYKKLGRISGLPAGTDSTGLCGVAFSNLSQAWAVCYGTPALYLVDAVNFTVARPIGLPGSPTCVATAGVKVLAGFRRDDGTGGLTMLSSNSGNYALEKVLDVASAPVAILNAPDPNILYVITADNGIFSFDIRSALLSGGQGLPGGSLSAHIGTFPNFAAVSAIGTLYLAGSDAVYSMTAAAPADAFQTLPGNYSIVGVDYYSDLLYAAKKDDPSQIDRVYYGIGQLATVALPVPIRALRFLNPSKVGQ